MKINRIALVAAALFVVVLCQAVYYNAIDTPFQFDDSWQVQDNFTTRDLRQTATTLTSEPTRWVTRMSYALNYLLCEDSAAGVEPNPQPFHIVNNIIHSINGVLIMVLTLMLLARLVPERTPQAAPAGLKKHRRDQALAAAEAERETRARGRFALLAAFLAGTVFVVHPLFSEGVTYVSGRSSSLCTTLALVSIVLYMLARDFAARRCFIAAVYFTGFSLGAFVLAMMTKESGVVVPVLIVLVELCVLSRCRFGRALRAWPFWSAFVLAFGAIAFVVIRRLVLTGAVAGNEGFWSWSYLLGQSEVVVCYAGMLLMPQGLSIDHVWPQFPELGWRFVPYFAIIAAAVVAAVWSFVRARRSRNPVGWTLAFLAIAWFAVTLAPTSSVIRLGDWMVERRVYMAGVLPVMCAGVLGAWALLRVAGDGRARRLVVVPALAMVLVVVALGGRTIMRNTDYRSQMSLWTPAMKANPTNFRMLHSSALCWLVTAAEYYDAGRYRQGLAALRNAEGMVAQAENLHNLRYDQQMYLVRTRTDLAMLAAGGALGMLTSDALAEVRRIERMYEEALAYAHEARLFALPMEMWTQRLECSGKIITAALQLGAYDYNAWILYGRKAEKAEGKAREDMMGLAGSFGNRAVAALTHAASQYENYVSDWPSQTNPHVAEQWARYETYLAYRLLMEYYRKVGDDDGLDWALQGATRLQLGLGDDVEELLEYYNRTGAMLGGERRGRR